MKHTPTPWRAAGPAKLEIKVEINGVTVACVEGVDSRLRGKERDEEIEYCKGNAAFIVKAVNAHHELIDSIKWLLGCMEAAGWKDDPAAVKGRAALAAAGEQV